jgi:hypothetical protein
VVHPAEVLDEDLKAYDGATPAHGKFRGVGIGDAEQGAVGDDQGPVAYVGEDEPV